MTALGHLEQLSIGIGCSSSANSEDVIRLVRASIHPLPSGTLLATIDRRASIAAIVASALDLRLVLFPASVLATVTGVTTHSPLALSTTQTASVAEASALASLGPSAHLIVPRRNGHLCTCAVASLPSRVLP
jgi:cobalt-precorrin 5A hydrolase